MWSKASTVVKYVSLSVGIHVYHADSLGKLFIHVPLRLSTAISMSFRQIPSCRSLELEGNYQHVPAMCAGIDIRQMQASAASRSHVTVVTLLCRS